MIIKCDKLTDENNNVLCDEFYYSLVKDKSELNMWYEGMKLIYTSDIDDEYDFDFAVDYMDDEQENIVEVITKVISKVNPDFIIYEIHVNHLKNSDGSTNLIRNACVTFQMPNGEFLVCRAPYYAFTKKAWDYIK